MSRKALLVFPALLVVAGLIVPAGGSAAAPKRRDKTPPSVSITSAPPGSTTATTASFGFVATDNVGVTGYRCSLDSAAYAGCVSGVSFSGIAVGWHTFRVQALDAAGNVSTPASYTWAVTGTASDTVSPAVTLTAPAPGASVSGSVGLSAAASDNVAVDHVTFRVDGLAIGSDSTAPYGLTWSSTSVPEGSHTVSVRAADTAGNVSKDSIATVTVANAAPAPAPAPAPGSGYCGTRSVGAGMVSDDAAALMRLSRPAERIPANTTANAVKPTQAQIDSFRTSADGSGWMTSAYNDKVTGSAAGTTDELISWAACKWGIDEDVIRAVAVQESDWRQSGTGDLCSSVYTSWGITQVKAPNLAAGCTNGWRGVWPMNRDSTPFNLDFYGSRMRECYDGKVSWWAYPAGDLWGCIGWWFSGSWHSSSGDAYAASVRTHLQNRDWERY
jgi:hypothetical protein